MQSSKVTKRAFLLAALVPALVPVAQAVELNTEALKTMQKEGHKIVEESEKGRSYKTGKNFCLTAAGNGLVLRECNDQAKTQKWKLDDQSRLVAHDGRCVAGPQLAKCGAGVAQKWKHDGKKRLSNQGKKCLQVQGNTPKAGAKVIAAACGNAAGQIWK